MQNHKVERTAEPPFTLTVRRQGQVRTPVKEGPLETAGDRLLEPLTARGQACDGSPNPAVAFSALDAHLGDG